MAKDIQADQYYVDMCNKRDMKLTEEWDEELKSELKETIREGDDKTLTEAKKYTDEHEGSVSLPIAVGDNGLQWNNVSATNATKFWEEASGINGALLGTPGVIDGYALTLCEWVGNNHATVDTFDILGNERYYSFQSGEFFLYIMKYTQGKQGNVIGGQMERISGST